MKGGPLGLRMGVEARVLRVYSISDWRTGWRGISSLVLRAGLSRYCW